MSYLTAVIVMVIIIVVISTTFWGIPMLRREKPMTGNTFVNLSTDVRYDLLEGGEGQDTCPAYDNELGARGWLDMPAAYEGNSASSVSHYIERSA